jgi:25S rRNA (uracil2843-N3)-methyltransferase
MGPPISRNLYRPAKKAPSKGSSKAQKSKASVSETGPTSSLPADLQQLLLNIFRDSFPERLATDIKPLLQEIKGHLYNRDFATAFGKEEYLETYALRWSPSRTLCYLEILYNLRNELKPFRSVSEDTEDAEWNIVGLGGGAGAEIVALGGLMKLLELVDNEHSAKLKIATVDIADWAAVVKSLGESVVTKPSLSKYASAAVQEANSALTNPASFNVTFHQHDILDTPLDTLSKLVEKAHLVTLLFTLNELYSASVSLTQKFLLNLTTSLAPGAHLLVVDSPGSYSTVSLNGQEKKYPMQWLLDHTLLDTSKAQPTSRWEKLQEEESKWFRLPADLRYPIELENMRYQLHLYRRCD